MRRWIASPGRFGTGEGPDAISAARRLAPITRPGEIQWQPR